MAKKKTVFPEYITKKDFKQETPQVLGEKVNALVRAMTQEEKLGLLHGHHNPENGGQIANAGFLPGVPRLGVPEIRMFDGSSGVTYTEETTSLPIELCLAATFDPDLAYRYGKVLGSENYAVSGNMQLGSQLDLIRSLPNAGGNMMGEDMCLAARLGVELTKGIQDQNCVAVLKHLLAAGGGAADRNQYSKIDEQTMHERFLPAFEAAAKEANAGAIMAAYDRINGSYVTQYSHVLQDVLRDQWGWRGFVMSDWGANHSLTTGKGTDMEMPYGAYNGEERVLRGIARGRLTAEDIDQAVCHILWGLGTAGYLSLVQLDEDGQVLEEPGRTERIRHENTLSPELLAENAEISYEIAKRGAVLLKNNGALPLRQEDYTGNSSVALLGLTAMRHSAGDGAERSYGLLKRMTSPYRALKAEAGQNTNIYGAVAMDIAGTVIPEEYLFQDEACSKQGLVRTYGILQEDAFVDPMLKRIMEDNKNNAGGAGAEFIGVADADDEDEQIPFAPGWFTPAFGDMKGYETGSFCCVDSTVDFTTGETDIPYKNGPQGNGFTKGSCFTWRGYLRVPEDGDYVLALHAIGGACSFRIWIEGQEQAVGQATMREGAHWPWSNIVCTETGMDINTSCFSLKAGVSYPVLLTAMAEIAQKDLQIQAAWITPKQKRAQYAEALKLASKADKVVLFVSPQREMSSNDKPFMRFGAQNDRSITPYFQQLIQDAGEAVHKNGGKLIVVLNIGIGLSGGVFVPGPWLSQCDALMDIWSPGQECGRATAELLLGKANPSGRMPITIPWRNEDGPLTDTLAHTQERMHGIPDENGNIVKHHSEGIFIGYRWYDQNGIAPCFPFGFGLSYTSFVYSALRISPAGKGFDVSFTVTNVGTVTGTEVAQIYLGGCAVPEHIQMAKQQLVAFRAIRDIAPGETKTVLLHIPERALCKWDTEIPLQERTDGTKDKWRRIQGSRTISVGSSSIDFRLIASIEVS